jgi:hypothetical protein
VPVVASIPVTDLLNPAKARRTPAEQRAKPIKRRELKNPLSPRLRWAGADCEVEFVFIEIVFFVFGCMGFSFFVLVLVCYDWVEMLNRRIEAGRIPGLKRGQKLFIIETSD